MTTLSQQFVFRVQIILLIVLLGFAGTLGYRVFQMRHKTSPPPSPIPSLPVNPTPTPIQLISGKETYSVSQSAHNGPTISLVVFDPLDVHKSQQLTINVTITDTKPITVATATLQTDGTTQEFTLTKSDQQDVWTGTVVPDNTLWYTYVLTITAKSANGTSSATVAPRS